ncbi:precorrin-2 C(20)-methyltransferase [Tessaracoccus antarcticus]|uniref:Precorrin-2 C(20)-methyltransferase n=1 Tax=Tessaracoccus antarcticus TaxID=2479848 RepID=A0A3M0G9H0_9ACTN|nr:precorrin-2 C(20)-methyltransferase [Tessaracoccus antarcticus]RMB61641.1 precorrin-2 C(20)-methyltransferase [Tessaracoccus antarcticus]
MRDVTTGKKSSTRPFVGPTTRSSTRPRLIGVGVGPGDPELVTVKALHALAGADVVLVPATEGSGDGAGRAETIVTQACPSAAPTIQRIPFSMADRSGISGRRKQAWLDSAEAAISAFESGADVVAFATVGDPSVYSTFSYLAAHVVERLQEVEVEVIPGITAMQALAARSRTPLVEGTETLALVPITAGLEVLGRVLDTVDTVVAYKGGRHLPEVVELLRRRGRDGVLGVQIGLDDEQLVTLTDVDEGRRAPYFSTVLVPAQRSGTGGRL